MARSFLTSINLNKNELQNARIHNLASAPAAPVAGQIYYNTADNKVYYYNGSAWVDITSPTLDPDLEAIAALTGTSGLLRKTAANTWSLDTNTYLTTNQTITFTGDATGSGSTSVTLSIAATVVTGKALTGYAVGTNTAVAATDTILQAIQKLQGQVNARLSANQTITLSGDVTGSGATGITATIAANAVTNAKLADMAVNTIKGRATAGTGDPEDLSTAQVRTMLSVNNVDNTSDLNKPISTATQAALDLKLNTSLKGAANGLAELDATGKVPSAQLPSYVDDIVEGANLAAFPGTGETGKIYVAIDTGYTYRWSGSAYVRVGASALTADEALKLTTARTIAATGDASWSVSFDGSGNVSAALTLAASGATAGTYGGNSTQVMTFPVDAKGRITGAGTLVTITPAWSSITSKPTTRDGFGITDVPRKYAAAIAGGATSEVITHNLNTRDCCVQVVRAASPWDTVECDIEMTTVNTITLRFAVAPAAGEYRIVVTG